MTEHERMQEQLSALADGELPEDRQRELEAHLEGCPECRALFEAFRALSGAMEPEEPPADLHGRIMDQIALSARVMERQRRLLRLRPIVSLAAAFVVVVGTALVIRGWARGGGMQNASGAAAPMTVMTAEAEGETPEAAQSEEAPAVENSLFSVNAPAVAGGGSATDALRETNAYGALGPTADSGTLPAVPERAELVTGSGACELTEGESLEQLSALLRECLESEPADWALWEAAAEQETDCLRLHAGDGTESELLLRGGLLCWEERVYLLRDPAALRKLFE